MENSANEDHWKRIYNQRPGLYQRLVACEDYKGVLLPALQKIVPLKGLRVVECGAGTGRVTRLLSSHANYVHAFDLTPAMLEVAQNVLSKTASQNWSLARADCRNLPAADGCADLAVEGWCFLQVGVWRRADWKTQVGRAVDEMLRLLHPGGCAILIETLGTGAEEPAPPQEFFAQVYAWWERRWGFQRTWVRTDYRFPSRQVAQEILTPFFGPGVEETGQDTPEGFILPECTGLWWLRT